MRDSASSIYRKATERVLASVKTGRPEARVAVWGYSAGEELTRWQRTLTAMRAGTSTDFATLSVGIDSVRKLTD